MSNGRSPGVQTHFVEPAPPVLEGSSVPAFLGAEDAGCFNDDSLSCQPIRLSRMTWETGIEASQGQHSQAQELAEALRGRLEAQQTSGFLAHAVSGFFENGGEVCYVSPLRDSGIASLRDGLAHLADLDAVDLVCAPDIVARTAVDQGNGSDVLTEVTEMQSEVLEHCDKLGNRFAILDAIAAADSEQVKHQRWLLRGSSGAIYHPWVMVRRSSADRTPSSGGDSVTLAVPPCGHIAGVYARSDQRSGVHKTPANETLAGVIKLQDASLEALYGELNDLGINCLRVFPGRGIRIWGGRTLSTVPAWRYVGTRRLFIEIGRWIERNMAGMVFEPNDARLWVRIRRELTAYLGGLFSAGALAGQTQDQAFFVRCDAETNPVSVQNAGQVVTEIGLAPTLPAEFIVVRIVHTPSGIELLGTGGPT